MLDCMRTTLDLNPTLLREAKRKAAAEGIPLRELVERALRAQLSQTQPARRYRLKLGSRGGGLMPGVSLEDWNVLRDRMDRSE